MLVAAGLLAVLSLRAPFAVAVFGIVLLGPLHVLLALRYLSGRVAGAVPAATGWLLVAFLSVMALLRAVSAYAPHLGQRLELFGSMALLAFALALGLHGRLRLLALLPLALATALAAAHLPGHSHLVAHAHNLIPLVFLWDWTRGHPALSRCGFMGASLLWAIGIPAAILLGLADPLLNSAPPEILTAIADPTAVLATAAPPEADPVMAIRFLAAFAFGQLMHYLLWMVFFQRWGRAEVAHSPLPSGWRLWTLGAVVSAAVWAAYAVSYYDGRAAYSVLGAFNAYLEQPVAIWLLLTALPATATSTLVTDLRKR